MTIKARLIMSTAALLCLATGVIGVIAIEAVTAAMTNRVDAQLKEFIKQPQFASAKTLITFSPDSDSPEIEPAYQPVAVMMLGADDEIYQALKAGYSTAQLELPELPDPLPAKGEITTVSAADGSTDYRLLVATIAVPTPGSIIPVLQPIAFAAPLTEVTEVRGGLISTMVATVVVILVLVVAGSSWITRRGLRPVDDMIDTAAAIADGDLSRRAKPDNRSELGKLARSLNSMVSKLVHALGEREAEQDRLRRFIADASHELRTPLATVGGYAELYKAGGTPPGPMLDRAMDRIQAENQRMARLIDDLLLLARLDQNLSGARERCDLTRLAADCVDDANAVDAQRCVSLEASTPVHVDADESRLRQVVSNLLVNTRQHTPPGTEVTVTVSQEGEQAVLMVADTGPGIAAEHREKVFDRLYRIDPSRSRNTGGTGLGLSIVSSIVEAHHGRVALDSELGEGTTVRVELPIAAEGRKATAWQDATKPEVPALDQG